jgi:hypothetical protein
VSRFAGRLSVCVCVCLCLCVCVYVCSHLHRPLITPDYRGQPDPMQGEALNIFVRKTANEVLEALFAPQESTGQSQTQTPTPLT